MKLKLLSLLLSLALCSCAAVDYQSLAQCNEETVFTDIEQNSSIPHATIESIPMPNWNTKDSWYAMVTHVNCAKLQEPWQITRVPANDQQMIRVKFNPQAYALDTMFPGVKQEFENVAQWLEFTPKPGKKYNLYVKTLTRWDMAYWVTLDGELIAHTEKFKPSFMEAYQ